MVRPENRDWASAMWATGFAQQLERILLVPPTTARLDELALHAEAATGLERHRALLGLRSLTVAPPGLLADWSAEDVIRTFSHLTVALLTLPGTPHETTVPDWVDPADTEMLVLLIHLGMVYDTTH